MDDFLNSLMLTVLFLAIIGGRFGFPWHNPDYAGAIAKELDGFLQQPAVVRWTVVLFMAMLMGCYWVTLACGC